MIKPAEREQIRIFLLRCARKSRKFGLSESLALQFVRSGGFGNAQPEDIEESLRYLTGKGLLARRDKKISLEIEVWMITAEGLDFLAQEGHEQ